MSDLDTDLYRFEPHPDMPGWMRWHIKDEMLFNAVIGDVAVRRDGDRAILRMVPQVSHTNLVGTVHGGALLTFVDNALFIGPRFLRNTAIAGLTLDLNTQFIGPADIVRPIDLTLEITRETGRMIFLRGTVMQEADMVASFMGIVRKAS